MKANSATWKASFKSPRETPTADEARRALGRVLGSPIFRDSLRLASFLKFVVEAALDGKSDRIKSYTIAVEALGRGPAFDPQADPIVRVEAGRLRQALARYYATTGCNDRIMIAMPRGAYVPCFTWRSPVMPRSQADGQMREVVAGWARGANISDRSPQLADTLAAFQDLLEIHRLQIAAISSEIDRAWQILKSSRALLQGAAVGSADGGEKTKARLLRRRARACMETTRRRRRALGQKRFA